MELQAKAFDLLRRLLREISTYTTLIANQWQMIAQGIKLA